MAKDQDELYGLTIRGTDRVMPFINPYRTHGELSEVDPAAFDDIRAFIDLDLSEDGWTGTVTGQASSTGSNGTSSARNFDIATF